MAISTTPAPATALKDLARSARGPLALAVAAPLIAGLLLLPQAWLLSGVIQRALVDGASVAALRPALALMAGLIAVRVLLVWAGEVSGNRAAERIAAGLRAALFRHLLGQEPQWSAARASGALSGAIVEQVEALTGFFGRYLPAMVLAAVLPLVFAVAAATVDPAVGALFLLTAPLIPVFMALVGWEAAAAHQQHQRAFLRLSGFFADRLRGLVTLKLLGRAEAEALRLRETGADLRQRTLGVLRIAFLSSAVLEFFAALGVAGVALYVGLTCLGFLHLHAVPLTLQAGLFCLLMAPEVYLPLRQFAAQYHDRAAALAAVEEMQALFGTLPALKPETVEEASPALLPQGALPVVASDLVVTAPGSRTPMLRGADLTVAPGAHVAIMGASGSGKSTLLDVLARLRAGKGRVEVGGVRIAGIPEPEYRRRVAVLGQRPRVFQGTIADNVRLGDLAACDAAVEVALDRAGLGAMVARLPRGIDTPVGEGGLGLSGGEAQRMALARLFLRGPDLILLDEPTAHLDQDTEAAVIDAILAFAKGRTLVVATHSHAVAARMDSVLRIEAGRLFATPHRRRMTANPTRIGVA